MKRRDALFLAASRVEGEGVWEKGSSLYLRSLTHRMRVRSARPQEGTARVDLMGFRPLGRRGHFFF